MGNKLLNCEAIDTDLRITRTDNHFTTLSFPFSEINHISELKYLLDMGFEVNVLLGVITIKADIEDTHGNSRYAVGKLLLDEIWENYANDSAYFALNDYLNFHGGIDAYTVLTDLEANEPDKLSLTVQEALDTLLVAYKLTEEQTKELRAREAEDDALTRHPDEDVHAGEAIFPPAENPADTLPTAATDFDDDYEIDD